MLIAWIKINNKKVTVATSEMCNKEKFKADLNTKNIRFDGVDKITFLGYAVLG